MAFGKKKDVVQPQELSEVGKRHKIRVSNPYGYYPEDVDKIILEFEKELEFYKKENGNLDKKLQKVTVEKEAADKELQRMKLDMSLMDIPDTSTEEDFSMFSRLNNINDSVGQMPEKLPEVVESRIPIDILEDKSSNEDKVFDKFVSKTSNMPVKKSPTINNSPVKKNANIFNDNGELDIL